jgi:Flp pilus assembly protein TadG
MFAKLNLLQKIPNIKAAWPGGEKGQSLVEMMIITPLLIFLLLGLFEVGNAIRGYLVLVNTNREITRYSVRPGYLDFSTADTAQASYQTVRDWADNAINNQLPLDTEGSTPNTTVIISHLVVDTGNPCVKANGDEDPACDTVPNCDVFLNPNQAAFTDDDLVLHPGMPGQWFQTRKFPDDSEKTTRLNYEALVKELKASNNQFNCEVLKKGGVTSNNNVVITEIFYEQPQLFGFPFISNPYTDPVPLYTHTSMRLLGGTRGYTLATVGPVCMAYPITFNEEIFDDPDNPLVPQSIDAFEGDAPGDFGWITWNPDNGNNNAGYVEKELKNPRLSLNDYTNVSDSNDHGLSIGDDVSTKPGVANSDGVDEQLQLLVGKEILIPVYDNNPGGGAGSYYHVTHFAKIRVDQICLPRNGNVCDGENKKQIKATFLGYEDEVCSGNVSGPNPSNNAPVANDDIRSTTQDTPIVIAVLDNDSDPDGDELFIDSVTSPGKGTVQISPDAKTITYQPVDNPSGVGTFTFDYTISDNNGGTDTATVTVTVVASGSNPPIANNDSATTIQDIAVTINVLGNDTDPNGDALTVTAVGTPANGTVTNNGDGTVTYTPNPGFVGADSFTYTINDGNGGTATATVTVTVTSSNNPPLAVNDSATTPKNTAVVINVLNNDSDPDGDSLLITSISEVSNPFKGTIQITGGGTTVTYTPQNNNTGSYTFSYTISDGNGGTDTANVTVTVTVPNNPPVAVDDSAVTDQDTAVAINIGSNDSDPDGDALIFSIGPASNGSVVYNGSGQVTYTPNSGFTGTDSFTYTVNDGNGGSDTATVTITVNLSNNPPVAANDSGTTTQDTAITINVLSNDSDPDGDTLTVTAVGTPANGTVTNNGNGTVTYTPNAGFTGSNSFTYTISDGNGGTATATVTVTVSAGPSVLAWDDFESNTWSGGGGWSNSWSENGSGSITNSNGPHGGSRHVLLDGDDTSRITRDVNMAGATSVHLKFYYKTTGNWESSDEGQVRIYNGSTLKYTYTLTEQTSYTLVDLSLSDSYMASDFRVQFRSNTSNTNEDMWVDDIEIIGIR